MAKIVTALSKPYLWRFHGIWWVTRRQETAEDRGHAGVFFETRWTLAGGLSPEQAVENLKHTVYNILVNPRDMSPFKEAA